MTKPSYAIPLDRLLALGNGLPNGDRSKNWPKYVAEIFMGFCFVR